MFLVTMARHWQLYNGAWFDGTIGIRPVTETVKAKCSSKNSAGGNMGIKPVTMDGEQYKRMMIKEFIPAVKARMPGAFTSTV
ncbi:unnamed protein product [Discosporangium mesarthrocarpum]